jgi:fructosamine-3-kinase
MPVVAVPVPQTAERQRNPVRRPLELIQGSLSARRIDRQSPWLASLHRISDGTLAGLGLAVVGLSALTLHWQGQWTQNFQKLEAAQRLEHRLQESAALLEQHHLAMTRKPNLLQPTSSEKLIYVQSPVRAPSGVSFAGLLAQVNPRRITAGY